MMQPRLGTLGSSRLLQRRGDPRSGDSHRRRESRMFPIQTKLPRIAFAAILGGLAAFPACAQSLQECMSTCFDCHGHKGQSQRPEVPSLGAQPASYTLIELVMFRDRLRVTEPMNEMTKELR